jgi:hypothetical protein
MKAAEIYDIISKGVSEGQTIKAVSADLAAKIGRKQDAVIKAFQRERANRPEDYGHGNAIFTGLEETLILSALLAFAQKRTGGSASLVVDVVTSMDLLARFQRLGEAQQSADTLRSRAYHWAERRMLVWKRQELIKTTSTKPVNKERSDTEQQIADGTVFFQELGRVFNAQGTVVKKKNYKKKKPLSSLPPM